MSCGSLVYLACKNVSFLSNRVPSQYHSVFFFFTVQFLSLPNNCDLPMSVGISRVLLLLLFSQTQNFFHGNALSSLGRT